MPAAVLPASLKHIEEALNVGVDIGVRVDQRVAHTRLGREMHDKRKAILGKQFLHSAAVRQVELNEAEFRERAGEFRTSSFLQCRVIISVHVVEPDNRPPLPEQPLRNMKSDKTGRSGDEDGIARHCVVSEPPELDLLGPLRTIEQRLHVQNQTFSILEELLHQRPPAAYIFIMRHRENYSICRR